MNAVKYAFPDERSGTIRLSFKANGDRGTLEVSDNGIGTTWPASKTSGLGSIIIESMVHSVKGTLDFQNEGGSRFRIFVPLSPERIKRA